jgi:iron complex transport system substrate-binding protein
VRIVSLLPSATEILFAVGAGEYVAGVTFECDFPPEARQCRVVSTTSLPTGLTPHEIDTEVRARIAAGEDLYTLDADALRLIDPDLVVTQDLCAVCAVDVSEVDQALNYLGCKADVVTLDPMTLVEVLASIKTVGRATQCDAAAQSLVLDLKARLEQVESTVAGQPRPRMAVLEWTDPPFSAGHWVPDMVAAAGAQSVLGAGGQRSEQIGWHDVHRAAPDVIVVSPCGYRLDGARLLAQEMIDRNVVPVDVPIWAVDADSAFVRPGPRLVDGVEALAHIAHPGLVNAAPSMLIQVR